MENGELKMENGFKTDAFNASLRLGNDSISIFNYQISI